MESRKARYDRRQQARKERGRESGRARLRSLRRTFLLVAGGVAAIVLVVGGLALFVTTRSTFGKVLPPTTFTIAHSESLPPRQINTAPVPRPVQEHVMERNATHPKGRMLVQYNCVQCPAVNSTSRRPFVVFPTIANSHCRLPDMISSCVESS